MTFIRNHPIVAFFALAYALAWGAIPFGSFFAPGALVAALVVVSLTEGVAGLRSVGARLIRWRVNWIWYVVAIAVPLFVHFATISLNQALGAATPDTGQFRPWYGIALVIGMSIVNPTEGPFSEEPSFRGYAQSRLQSKRTPLVATAIVAAAVTGWHLPLFFISSFQLRPFEAVTTVAVTFWYAWLFNHASGSALLTLIAHAAEGSINSDDLWPAGADSTRETWLYLAVWCAVAIVLLIGSRRFWTSPAPAQAIHHIKVKETVS